MIDAAVLGRGNSAFSCPGFVRVWAAGWLWMGAQFMSLFTASYLIDNRTGNALLVQVAGMCFYLPMFLGGILIGALSDRFAPRRICRIVLLAVAPAAAAFGLLSARTSTATVFIYPLMLAIGVCALANNVTRRTLVYDVVGPNYLTNSMALEMVSMAGSSLLGPLLAGVLISTTGYVGAYLVVAGLFVTSAVVMGTSRDRASVDDRQPVSVSSLVRQARDGLSYTRHNRMLFSLLGVTLLANIFYFSFIPIIPVIARHLGVDAVLAGLLSSGTGIGQFLGAIGYSLRAPNRRGRAYALSPLGALFFLLAFSRIGSYVPALVCLVAAGLCSAGFAVLQSTLVLHIATREMRGRAMGVTAMAIGGQPFGILGVGILANAFTPESAILMTALAGITLLIGWSLRFPHILDVR